MNKLIKDIFKNCIFTTGGLLVLMTFTKCWGFIPAVPHIIILAFYLIIIARSIYGGDIKVSIPALFFLCFSPIGIIYFHPDPCFKSWLRYFNFALLFISIGPVFNNTYSVKLKKQAFNMLMICAIFTGVISFFCFFLGINFMTMFNAQENMRTAAGMFGGLCNHSMTLGPIAAIGAVGSLYMFLLKRRRIFLFFSICCLGSTLFSASRAALLAALVGIFVMFYYISDKRTVMMSKLIRLCVLAILTFPLWKSATDLLVLKQETNIEKGGFLASREKKYIIRVEEFLESPLFGVGFCAIDPSLGDDYISSSGTIEPGSSWLQIPSMTGLAGTIPFIFILIGAWRNTKPRPGYPHRGLLLGLLVLFFIHFCAEGYILSAGGEMCFIAWLIISCCVIPWYDNIGENKSTLKFI